MFRALPEGYVDLDRGRWRVVAPRIELREMTDLIERVRGGEALGEPVESGRGGARRVVLRGGKVVYVRPYRRGGLVRFLVRDLYLLRPPRPVRELEATERARAAGCRVPIVQAVAVEERGLFYRGWIVTSAIDEARSLCAVMAEADEAGRGALLAAAGAAVRDLHEAGVYHRDLTGENLLVEAGGRVAVIDFDRALVAPPGQQAMAARGLDRLWRSLRKAAAAGRFVLPEADRRWLDRGYAR